MPIMIKNEPMHGEVSTIDASAGSIVTLFRSGTFTSYDIDDPEFLLITDFTISSAAGGLVSLFCDSDNTPTTVGAGEAIFQGTLPANGLVIMRLNTPYKCKKGASLVLKAPSGQVNCQVSGFIKANPNSSSYPNALNGD